MFGESNLWPSHRTYDIGDEDPLIEELSKAMARLSISGQTELASRSSNSCISNNGGSTEIKEAKGTGRSRAIEGESIQQTLPRRIPPETQDKTNTPVRTPSSTKCLKSTTGESRRVKKTPREGLEVNPKPSPKRGLEDLESASIRRHPECSGYKGRGEKTWRGGSKKAKHDVRSCFDERGNTKKKKQHPTLPSETLSPKKAIWTTRQKKPTKHASPGPPSVGNTRSDVPGRGRAQSVPWKKKSWARGRHTDLCVTVTF